MLVEEVDANYEFLTSALSAAQTKIMVDAKWNEISTKINAFGIGTRLEAEKVKKKWFEMKSTAKKAVAEYKQELAKTSGGSIAITTPSELQFKIASFVGLVYTEGIPKTENCDVAGNSNTY